MSTTLDGRNIGSFLKPDEYTPGVTEKEVHRAIKEMADRAKNRVALLESGPFPASPIPKTFWNRFFGFFR
ncbi:MAG: hypothetical protein V1896_01875 [Candidatus Zambryskibacteria bacterium]